MTKSIISNEKRCVVCGKTSNLHFHHCLFGKNRKKADEDKLLVYLCVDHHEGVKGVHGRDGKELDLKLKQIAEYTWLEYYNKTEDDWIKRYGKNYL